MWVWEVVEVVPITCLLSNLWELLLHLLLWHAMLVDVDWVSEIHDRCEIDNLMVYLRWQLKHTSGWIEAPGYSSDCLFFFWTATQAQRDHEIIHTRNFRVQPQATMGSSIVD